ncbi:MAG: hypothetical protein FJZ80_07180 [Bacteroidetes bacterium]|nr:hypothetical protein [Bacteroidota bacterium]
MSATMLKDCLVKCALRNEWFSQDYADKHHQGHESENNIRFEWEDEFMVRGVTHLEFLDAGTYHMCGVHPTMGEFAYPIANMQLIYLHHPNGTPTTLAFSQDLIGSMDQENDQEKFELRIELCDAEPFINPIAGVYIAHRDIPRALKNA